MGCGTTSSELYSTDMEQFGEGGKKKEKVEAPVSEIVDLIRKRRLEEGRLLDKQRELEKQLEAIRNKLTALDVGINELLDKLDPRS